MLALEEEEEEIERCWPDDGVGEPAVGGDKKTMGR